MPKQRRWAFKRSLDQAVKAIDKAQNYLIDVAYPFEIEHPGYFEAFTRILKALESVKEAIIELSDQL